MRDYRPPGIIRERFSEETDQRFLTRIRRFLFVSPLHRCLSIQKQHARDNTLLSPDGSDAEMPFCNFAGMQERCESLNRHFGLDNNNYRTTQTYQSSRASETRRVSPLRAEEALATKAHLQYAHPIVFNPDAYRCVPETKPAQRKPPASRRMIAS